MSTISFKIKSAPPGLDGQIPSYFDLTILSSNTDLYLKTSDIIDAWCLDPAILINGNTTYLGNLYSSYEVNTWIDSTGKAVLSDITTNFVNSVALRETFNEINWLINQDLTTKGYTVADVQGAIWTLLGKTSSWDTHLNPTYTPSVYNDIVNTASTHKNFSSDITDYVPGTLDKDTSNDYMALIVDPVNSGNTHVQPLIIKVASAAIGNYVWHDLNANGIQDANESGIAGATVNLFRDMNNNHQADANEILQTTTTQADGSYKFVGLAPTLNYQVQFVTPQGYAFSSPRQVASTSTLLNSDGLTSDVVVLHSGEINQSIDAGFYNNARVSGYAYIDANNDGIKDPSEAPLANTTVTLSGTDSLNNPVNRVTSTLADGSYVFNDVRPSNDAGYTITETQPAGYLDGKDSPGTGSTVTTNDSFGIILKSGDNSDNNNFGELTAASINGFVYNDSANNNGVKELGESGLAGVSVTLTGKNDLGDTVNTTVTTLADGSYTFSNLRPSDSAGYTVTETQAAGYLDGKDSAGSSGGSTATNDTIASIVLNAGINSTDNNFGELTAASINGFVYNDSANNNGVKELGESGIAGVSVTLTGKNDLGDTVNTTVTTLADGSYTFSNLRPSDSAGYTVTETQAAGYLDGKDSAGSSGGSTATNDTIASIVLNAGINSTDNNFGELTAASINGFVYNDSANNNGVKELGESGIAGVSVTLTGKNDLGDTVNTTVTTLADGSYTFSNLRPSDSAGYTVTETQAAGYLDGKDSAGSSGGSTATNDTIASIVLNAGINSTDNNFGELTAASINGFVYNDSANNNGVKELGESGLAGVSVTLTGKNDLGDTVNTTVTTLADGSYTFSNLRPSDSAGYTVTETQPPGYLDGKDSAGSLGGDTTINDKIASIVLNAGNTSNANNFGELLKPTTGCIDLSIFNDINKDTIKSTGETGISGISVSLVNLGADGKYGTPDDQIISTIQTDSNGTYDFDNLVPGNYAIITKLPENKDFSFTTPSEVCVPSSDKCSPESDSTDDTKTTQKTDTSSCSTSKDSHSTSTKDDHSSTTQKTDTSSCSTSKDSHSTSTKDDHSSTTQKTDTSSCSTSKDSHSTSTKDDHSSTTQKTDTSSCSTSKDSYSTSTKDDHSSTTSKTEGSCTTTNKEGHSDSNDEHTDTGSQCDLGINVQLVTVIAGPCLNVQIGLFSKTGSSSCPPSPICIPDNSCNSDASQPKTTYQCDTGSHSSGDSITLLGLQDHHSGGYH